MSYIRLIRSGRGDGYIFIDGIDPFKEVMYKRFHHEILNVNNKDFLAFHCILDYKNNPIMTAYRSIAKSDILLIVWRGLPYTHHIEQGGDLMLQEIHRNGIKHLIIDNTHVDSMWMNPQMEKYFYDVWYPGLIQLNLEKFVHIQSASSLGKNSFERFRENIRLYLERISAESSKKLFEYIPIESNPNEPWVDTLKKSIQRI